jgi:DNA polymerase-3 subunit alpha (Gram-positive type)
LDTIKVGDVVKIKGKYDFVKGSTNLIFNAYSLLVMGVSKNDKVYDTAYRPRIEVLCHTKFSAFDGLNTANEIIDYSLKSKMPAIGFCDRNNLQGYPDIDTAASKQKQKALYGYEVSVLNDEIPCVINVSETNLPIKDQEYVIFDIETTSLTNEDGDIIEFGAVKTKGGIVISRLDLLIKPSKLVSQFTTELTHITNEMLADKPTFNECAQQILDFVGNSILVAHNGIDFDIRFLNKKLIQNGFKSIENTLIDTLMISRAIHPEFQRHRLGFICRKYKIQYDETVAHRADFDAEVTYRVWQVYINELIDRGITTIETINSRFNTSELHKQLFPSYMNIYAKNKVGLKQLYKLATKSLTEQYYDEKPTLYRKQLNENRENLIICNNPYESSL